MQEFGERLRARRKELGLTRQRLSEMTGLSYAYVTQLESGRKSSPSPKVLLALASALRLEPDDLAPRAGGLSAELPPAPPEHAGRDVEWHANPRYVSRAAAAPPATSRRTSSGGELDRARGELMPALERLLAPYSAKTRLALLNDLQQQALRDLGV